MPIGRDISTRYVTDAGFVSMRQNYFIKDLK